MAYTKNWLVTKKPIRTNLTKDIVIEPRQFAQIGTPNFTGATIIPHADETDECPAEYVQEMVEIEQITFEDEQMAEVDEECEDDEDSYSYVAPQRKTKTECGQPSFSQSNDSSMHYDSSCDMHELMKKERIKKESGGEGEHSFACRHCGKRYRWKSTLKRHERVECGGAAPSYGCPYCTYKAKQRGNLSVHMRKHHPDKPQLASTRKKSK